MKIKSNNFKNFGYRVITFIFLVIQISILLDIIIFSDSTVYSTKKSFLLPNSLLMIFSIAICFLVYLLTSKHEISLEIEKKYLMYWFIGISALLFIVQLVISYNIYFFTGWDAGGIRSSVFETVNGTYNIWYPFSIFPNNVNITALMVIIFRLFVLFGLDGYQGVLVISALLVNIAGLFTLLSTYKVTNSLKCTIFSWVLFVILVALSPWITIPYSDTYSILFPIFAFYLYISQKTEKKNYLRWFLIGFLCLYGYTIKPTAIIVLIAIIIVESWKIISNFNRKGLYRLLFSLIMIISAILPIHLINTASKNLIGIELDSNQAFSFYHFAMMGLNSDSHGVYSENDTIFSMSYDNVEDRNAANVKVIKERLTDFGVLGYLKFLGKKALVNFSDGSFAWSVEGNFYQEVPNRDGELALFLKNLYYRSGTYHIYLLTIEQLSWFVILILLPAISLSEKRFDPKKVIVMLAIIGITTFVMLFEARARYLYSFTPFFIMGASIGLNQIIRKFRVSKGNMGLE